MLASLPIQFSYQLLSAILAVFVSVLILFLVRRGHLHLRRALFWLCTAALVLVLGLIPDGFSSVAHRLGVYYGPTLLFVLAFVWLLLKLLFLDIENSRLGRDVRRLTQTLAILEHDLHSTKANKTTDNLPMP